MDTTWECIVIGAGAAGLSAALVLGRARRRVLVIDAGGQSNLTARGVGGLLGHNGRPPADLYAAGRAEVETHPTVRVRDGEVVAAVREGNGFTLDLADGDRVRGARLLLATGMEYRPPALDGIGPRWGRSVFHCPFCHGWEVRERPLGALGAAAERALLLRMWSDNITLFTDGTEPTTDDRARLEEAGIAVVTTPVARLHGEGDALHEVELADGVRRPCEGLLVAATLHQRGPVAAMLGLETVAGPMADALVVDGRQRTGVPGVFAAGDAASQMPSVAAAIAAGSLAAASVVQSIAIGD